jgi:putative ABC transport system substrate-binding protein
VIGLLSSTSPSLSARTLAAFHQGLSETGYVEGQNLAVEYRWAEGRYDRLPAMAADLVARNVDVIAAFGGPPARAAKAATSTIPVVFAGGLDPVAGGLVASLPRPGGNVTGIDFLSVELAAKRLELLHELIPQAKIVALLVNPEFAATERVIQDAQQAAHVKGLQLRILKASTDPELDAAFTALVQLGAGGLVAAGDPFLSSPSERLVELATRAIVPAIYPWRESPAVGGLISYGTSRQAVWRAAGTYVGKILGGAKPADLPVQQPTTFELVINLNTAKVLGLTVPHSLLARADEVIE